MKNIKVVIGSNFGDEGKGLMTDYISSKVKDGIVVRFCGGTQAGHTVTTPDGKRHVFGHIGSGAFSGLPTYLSSFFVANPMTFNKEFSDLSGLIKVPTVFVDPDCIVTTPYDMMINQIAEIVRGKSKHGSCGLGINETIERNLVEEDIRFTVKDLLNECELREKLIIIRDTYTNKRLNKLGIEEVPERYKALLNNDGIIESYILDVRLFLNTVKISGINVLSNFNSIVFEGSQGLLLDQSHEYFPYVTRSNTGMKNVKELIKEMGCQDEDVEVVYATRAYLTRHGAGPFITELPNKPYKKIEDLTNIPNPYQGTLRFGLLDVDLLAKTIKKDLVNTDGLNCTIKLGITCLDQLDDIVDYKLNNQNNKAIIDEFIGDVFTAVGVEEGYISYGATRSTIQHIKL